ncbi:MAG: ligase-associated DNA damage response endonuclease PdeM, partial [Burkholderiaceae bacterium]
GQALWLAPQGAYIHPQTRTAFISDLHLGKSASFRQAGLAVPEGSDAETLSRLATLLSNYTIQTLVILGDLIHDAASLTDSLFSRLARLRSEACATDWHLVLGNHDQKAGSRLEADWADRLGVRVFGDRWEQGIGLVGLHIPEPSSEPSRVAAWHGDWQIAGHLHPSVVIRAGAGQRLRLPCFVYHEGRWLLPAFGEFTGSMPITARAYAGIFPVADGEVFTLKPLSGSGLLPLP